MKNNKKYLQTNFLKFILEKYSNEGQELPDEDEIENPDEETEPQLKKKNKLKKLVEFDDVEPNDDEVDDEIIDELLNEYKRLKKKYESNRIHIGKRR